MSSQNLQKLAEADAQLISPTEQRELPKPEQN